jgi:hypothetical protein
MLFTYSVLLTYIWRMHTASVDLLDNVSTTMTEWAITNTTEFPSITDEGTKKKVN